MRLLSILMPARNAHAYIEEAVMSVLRGAAGLRWELVVVNDHSTDSTGEILLRLAKVHPRVQVLDNAGRGKIAALNLAYANCRGDLITTLDSDDCLVPGYFRLLSAESAWDAMCKDYTLVDSVLRPLAVFHIGKRFQGSDFDAVLTSLRSVPRASWTMTRLVADRVFPVPENLPFEDVWFSLAVKRFAPRIRFVGRPLYLYRQHSEQTYGGMLNYNPRITKFRARRLEAYARLLPGLADRLECRIGRRMEPTRRYYEALGDSVVSLRSCRAKGLSAMQILTVMVFRRLWPLLSVMKRIQWTLSRIM